MGENLRKMCRFCLYEDTSEDQNQIIRIFECEVDLAEKIKMCTQINISPDDNIPPNICTNCADCIMAFHKFLDCTLKSEKVLKEIYPSDPETDINTRSERSKSHISNEQAVDSNMERDGDLTKPIDSNIKDSQTGGEVSDDFIEDSDSDSSVKENIHPQRRVRKVVKINEHVKKITTDNTYVCTICSEEFTSFFEYQDHQETHNGQLVFSCTKCDQVFSERSQLVEHDANHKVACQVCSKMVLPRSLTAHLKKHTDMHRSLKTVEHSHRCPECSLSHTSRAALEKHIKARHMGQKGLVCHICGKQSSCQSSLNRHLASHNTERPHQCKHCNFSTKSHSVLKVHMSRKHFGVQQSCTECGKSFKSEISLKQHIKRIHNPRRYECHMCQKAFTDTQCLERHILRKHSRLYECKVCTKGLSTVRELKEHMNSHKQGGVSCPNCGKQFFYKKYLEKHMDRCMPGGGENFKDRLCRLKSTISLPGRSMQS